MSSAVWLRLMDLAPLHHAGLPDHGPVSDAVEYAHINTESGLIVVRTATGDPGRGGQHQLWCIPPGGRAVLVAADDMAGGADAGEAPHCDRAEKLMNVRAPF